MVQHSSMTMSMDLKRATNDKRGNKPQKEKQLDYFSGCCKKTFHGLQQLTRKLGCHFMINTPVLTTHESQKINSPQPIQPKHSNFGFVQGLVDRKSVV